jgi:formylglycine-generating enzyme required for sulfatase activity
VWQLYREEDSGLHGAAEWLLRKWGRQKEISTAEQQWVRDHNSKTREQMLERMSQELAKDRSRVGPRWYINGQGQTMVVIPSPGDFRMGSPAREAGREGGKEGQVEALHWQLISHSYIIGAKEVTVAQLRLCPSLKRHEYSPGYSPTEHHPANNVTWYEAAAYCNWLSEQEGLAKAEWCYEPHPTRGFAEGMKIAPGYHKRIGYRLPTEAEWEHACRAGALTSRYYGESEVLLGRYAQYSGTSLGEGMLPGGSLKPNDFGLFDMLGNAMEWCQDRYDPQRPGRSVEDHPAITDDSKRVLRGGSFLFQPPYVRSARRLKDQPNYRDYSVGFRPARTLR